MVKNGGLVNRNSMYRQLPQRKFHARAEMSGFSPRLKVDTFGGNERR
jgi:hypothetical protein